MRIQLRNSHVLHRLVLCSTINPPLKNSQVVLVPSQEQLQSIFIVGLQPRIRRVVQCQRPRDLHDTFALARLYEAQLAETYTSFN
jgi:hypothetical protein